MSKSQFDEYANNYQEVVNTSAGIIPYQKDFFFHSKIDLLAKMVSKLPKGSKVLDYGCGVGSIIVPLSKIFPEIQFYAFDVSIESVMVIEEEGHSNITCLKEDNLREMKDFFDFIFCINVFHHIEKRERPAITGFINSLLLKKGKLLILEHNPINPLTRLVVSRCEFDEGVELLSRKELFSIMAKNQFKELQHWYILFFPLFNKFFQFIEDSIRFLPFGAQHCIVGEKE